MNISSISDSTIMEEYVKRFTIKAGKGIKTSREAADHFRAYFAESAKKREQFVVCFLNGQHRVLATEKLFTGSITTSAEENLLCLENDRYYGENIAIHEFAHTISILGLGSNFDSLLLEFTEIYETALEEGLWENTYAGSNMQEYWAEGVQSYFNANIQSVLGDGVHNHVNTREELAEYDPVLYDFISDIFNDHEWTPTCPNEE